MARTLPEWTQKGVLEDLRRRINEGRLPEEDRPADALPVGSPVPTLDELMVHYGVAKATAAGAARTLARQGLIATAARTTGRVVGLPTQTLYSNRYRSDLLRAPDGSYTFERLMREAGWQPHTLYRRVGFTEDVPGYVANAFWGAALDGPPPQPRVVERIRRRTAAPLDANGKAVVSLERTITIFESHLPEWVGLAVPEVATTERVGIGGCYALLADRGLPIVRRRETIDLRPPTDSEAFAFSILDLETVVEIQRHCFTAGDRIVTIDKEVTLPWCVRFVHEVMQEA